MKCKERGSHFHRPVGTRGASLRERARMKITDVRCVVYDWKPPIPFTGPMATSMGEPGTAPNLLVRVLTDEGVEGNCGEMWPAVVAGGIVKFIETYIRPILVGQDPIYREDLWQKIWRIS
jgi:L-alanine-DL-glutamate epimerase-like enolase superfamily enzyme